MYHVVHAFKVFKLTQAYLLVHDDYTPLRPLRNLLTYTCLTAKSFWRLYIYSSTYTYVCDSFELLCLNTHIL